MRANTGITWLVAVGYTALTLSCAWGLIICAGESGARVTFLHTHFKAQESRTVETPIAYSEGSGVATPWKHIGGTWHIHVALMDAEHEAQRPAASVPRVSIGPSVRVPVPDDTIAGWPAFVWGAEPPNEGADIGASLRSTILLI